MVSEEVLREAVDAAFAVTGQEHRPWPDPHPDRSPSAEEYSRLTDPDRWRIIGARADAWLHALVDLGLADVATNPMVRWSEPPRTEVSRLERVVPRAIGALPLIVARSRLGPIDDAGVTLGVGDPAVELTFIPDCGCDACDSGSQDVLDDLDVYVFSVVSGRYRRLWSGDRRITVLGDDGWRASGRFRRGEVQDVIGRPDGWHVLSGTSWLDAAQEPPS